MALPSTSVTILDNGLGVSSPATSRPCVIGPCAAGPTNAPTLVSNQRQLREIFGEHGPLVDAVGYILTNAGGPVLAIRSAGSVAATYDNASTDALASSSGAGVDNEINVAVADSAPKNDYELLVTIATGGALAATTFTYSLDGGFSTSPVLAAGATINLGSSGVQLHFEAGTTAPFVAGATYATYAKAARMDATDLGAAFDAIEGSLLTFDFLALAGAGGTAGEQAALASTCSSRLATLLNTFDRFYGVMLSAGDDGMASGATAGQVLAATSALADSRLALVYGKHRSPAPIAITGRALPLLPGAVAAAMRGAGNLISTDLAQTSGAASVGALPGCLALSHDEFLDQAGLDDAKIGTLRTYPNLTGFYLTNVWLKSNVGSDFEFWQHRRIMDQACAVVSREHSLLISSSVLTKTDGTGSLTEFSAQQIEKRVQRALDNVLGSGVRVTGPASIDGTIGHVSDVRYQCDRQNNVLATKTLIATVSIVPRGYLKALEATLSFKLAV